MEDDVTLGRKEAQTVNVDLLQTVENKVQYRNFGSIPQEFTDKLCNYKVFRNHRRAGTMGLIVQVLRCSVSKY